MKNSNNLLHFLITYTGSIISILLFTALSIIMFCLSTWFFGFIMGVVFLSIAIMIFIFIVQDFELYKRIN